MKFWYSAIVGAAVHGIPDYLKSDCPADESRALSFVRHLLHLYRSCNRTTLNHLRRAFSFSWQGQEDSEPSPARARDTKSPPSASMFAVAVRRRTATVSHVSHHNQNKSTVHRTVLLFWQGQEDSNPRPTVLETGTLPAELYPCLRRLLAT